MQRGAVFQLFPTVRNNNISELIFMSGQLCEQIRLIVGSWVAGHRAGLELADTDHTGNHRVIFRDTIKTIKHCDIKHSFNIYKLSFM